MERRDFLRNVSLAIIGGIFVPKYERWFRNPVRYDVLSIAWPTAEANDVALLYVHSKNHVLLPLRETQWTLLEESDGHFAAVYWARAPFLRKPVPPRIKYDPQSHCSAQIMTFRGCAEGDPFDRVDGTTTLVYDSHPVMAAIEVMPPLVIRDAAYEMTHDYIPRVVGHHRYTTTK